MKNTCIKNISLLILILMSLTSCTKNEKKSSDEKQTYTCPMHPDVINHEMGICPICKMDLVLVNKNSGKESEIMLSEEQIKLANIKTTKIANADFNSTKEIKGVLNISPLATKIVSSRFGGRIEQLLFKEPGLSIKKGQTILSIYSEELLALQNDYLLNIKQKENFPNDEIYAKLTEAARKKLVLYGYTNQQIQNLTKTKKTNARINVVAQENGIIKEINVNEGQYITEGTKIFVLEDLTTLWIDAEVYPYEAKNISIGQNLKVRVNGYENEPVNAKVEFISPQLQENTQLVSIRASLPNKDKNYQAGMYVSISLDNTSESNIIKLPINAIIRDESHNQVWVRTGNNTFEPRYVTIGSENENDAIISEGLKANDEVVISGAYLLYSQLKLKK